MTEIPYRWNDPNRPVETWCALQELGFDTEEDKWGCPSLSYDFGRFKLEAARMMNLQMREVVSFSTFVSNPRTMTSVEFDMPLRVESKEQCAAWIAWHFKRNLPQKEKLVPIAKTKLLVFGLQHQATLPWERARILREQEAERYRLRPSCIVEREVIKLGLRSLAKHIEQSADSDRINIWFDSQILSFLINGKRVIVQADGFAWKAHYSLPAVVLRTMPRRLYSEAVDVSIWNDRLQIDRSRYDGIVEIGPNASCLVEA